MPLRIIVIPLLLTLLAACSSFTPPATPTLAPLETQGKTVFESYCSRCHATSGDTIIVGPSLAGIANRGHSRVEGMDAPEYIRSSISDPGAVTVEGFSEGLMPPNLKDQLTAEEMDAVVAYLMTLK